MTLRGSLSGLALALLFLPAAPVRAQQPSPPAGERPDADQSAAVPTLPRRSNPTVELGRGDEPSTVHPRYIRGTVVRWEVGKSVVVQRAGGSRTVVPIPSTIEFPPDLKPGGPVTITTEPLQGGGFRVVGFSTAPPPTAVPRSKRSPRAQTPTAAR